MKFSQRAGLQPTKLEVQISTVSPELRNRLWNVLHITNWNSVRYDWLGAPSNEDLQILFRKLWNDYFKRRIDELPILCRSAINELREYFIGCQWFQVYDLIEFVSDSTASGYSRTDFMNSCNAVLAEELSAYRFVAGKIVPISAKEDVAAIEAAIAQTASLFPTASQHLQAAISLLARKPNPDYRNTIKESISAVEALCNAVTGEPHGTLGQALKVLDFRVHPALGLAFEKLYGYTSDAEGIRHALMDEQNLQQEDALFMLVACSAFIGYLVSKYARKKQP
jgi:hypothetical protein